MKKLTALFLVIASGALLHGEIITFPIAGMETNSELPVTLQVQWEDSWFYQDTAFEYNHGIARIAALLSEVSYTDVEDNPNNNALKKSYSLLGVKDEAMEFHYNIDYSTPVLQNNQAAFSFASKTIHTKDGNKTILFVVIRGTPLNANEWISNFSISDSSKNNSILHEGFYFTMINIHNALIYYMLKQKIDPDDTYFLITGHSRGAALSNLLGATLINEGIFKSDKLFVYTFAAPNVSQAPTVTDLKYNFIWNIVNGEDIVPTVPPCRNNWKFNKYGHVIVLPNRWSVSKTLYDEDYIPRVNEIYNQLLGRDYCPFKIGTFLQSQISRLITSLYEDVNHYYNGKFNLRKNAETLMWKVFPQNQTKIKSKMENHRKSFLESLSDKVNEKTGGGVEYAMNAFVDMHACELYLSWMIALNESEIFSGTSNGSVQLIIDGYYECAVFDKDDNLLARIIDGVIQYKDLRAPVSAMPIPAKKTVIGFPLNEEFNCVIYKASLLPTIISAQIEEYDSTGKMYYKTQKQHFFPHVGMGLKFKAGKILVDEDTVTVKKIYGKALKNKVTRGRLKQDTVFMIQPEINIDTDKQVGLGVHIGNREIYGSILTSQPLSKFGKSLELSPGFGHQMALYSNIMLDTEIFGRCMWIFSDKKIDDDGFNFIPSLRLSLSIKPIHKWQLFAAGVFDFNISSFNDGAFDTDLRKQNIRKIYVNDKLKVIPSVQFGLRF